MADNGASWRRWYVLSLAAVIMFIVFGVSMSCMPVLFSEIADELGLNIVQIGTVWGFSSVAGIFSIILAGLAVDRFGAKRTLAVACLLAGVFGALRGLSDSFLSLTITSLAFGFASEAVPVIVIKNTSMWFHERGLGTAQGILTACVGAGLMLGAMLSATVLSPLLGGWKNVVFLYGAICVFVGLIWFLTVPEPRQTEVLNTSSRPTPRHALSNIARNKGVWLIAMAMMGFAGANKGLFGYLPLYLRNSGWTAVRADGALAALNAAGTSAAIPFTFLSDRLGLRKAVLIPGLIVTFLGIGLLSVVNGPAVWLLAIMAGIFREMVWAVAATITVETKGVGPVYAGTAVGIVHAMTRVGYTFSPPAGNSLESIHPGLPFAFWGVLSLAALIAFLFVRETGRGRQIAPTLPG
jgi:predicted MFS family arabinose efflux permease